MHMVSWEKITKPKARGRGGSRHPKGEREKPNFGSKALLEKGECK